MTRTKLVAAAVVLLLAATLPFLSAALLDPGAARCARDGVEIGALLRIRIERADGTPLAFCSVRCAEDWLLRAPTSGAAAAVRVLVADETSGRELDARDAVFVRSSILTSRTTGEAIHAFARRADADDHAAAYGGVVLEGADRPFRPHP